MEQILFAIVIALALYVIFFPFFSSLDAYGNACLAKFHSSFLDTTGFA
jgi:hypothetical protein